MSEHANERIVTADGNCEEIELSAPPARKESAGEMSMRRDIQAELQWCPLIDDRLIGVQVAEGVLTLSGTVGTYEALQAVLNIACRTQGMRAIVNELVVRCSPERVLQDEALAEQTIEALHHTLSTRSAAITPIVTAGWIRLEGSVLFAFQREAAEACLRQLQGMRGIQNNLRIRSSMGLHELRVQVASILGSWAFKDACGSAVRKDISAVPTVDLESPPAPRRPHSSGATASLTLPTARITLH